MVWPPPPPLLARSFWPRHVLTSRSAAAGCFLLTSSPSLGWCWLDTINIPWKETFEKTEFSHEPGETETYHTRRGPTAAYRATCPTTPPRLWVPTLSAREHHYYILDFGIRSVRSLAPTHIIKWRETWFVCSRGGGCVRVPDLPLYQHAGLRTHLQQQRARVAYQPSSYLIGRLGPPMTAIVSSSRLSEFPYLRGVAICQARM